MMSKRSLPPPLEWNIESYSSRNIDEEGLIAQSSYTHHRSEPSQPTSHEHDVRTYSTNGIAHSMPIPVPTQEHSSQTAVAASQTIPYPMSDLQHTSYDIPHQSQFSEQDPLYQAAIQDYPPRISSPYIPQQSYHEEKLTSYDDNRHISPSSSYSPRERSSTTFPETSTAYSSSPRNEEYFSYGVENTRLPSTNSGRRPRRSRKTTTPHSPYRKEYRHVRTRGHSTVGRPRKSRNHNGRTNRGSSSFASQSSPLSLNDSGEFGTDPNLIGNDNCGDLHFDKDKVYIEIIEQPQPKALRFRYICEGRSAGSIPGVNSTPENKTYPTIKIGNYKGPALAVVSCVTVNAPHRPHPHNLVGKDGCDGGVCSVVIDNDTMICSFSNLGIQCVKKRDVEKSLLKREEKNVDPYCTGFSHRNQPQNIDLNAVRLCFQIYLKDRKSGDHIPLPPIVSEPIYDKKATADLVINKLSDCSSSAYGGREIILLCDKVTKEDVQVRFFELDGSRVVWEDFGEFQASDVHKQVAITFKTPKYSNLDIKNPVNAFVQLCRPSDNCTSEPRPFLYYPLDTEETYILKKLEELRWDITTAEQLKDIQQTANLIDESQTRIAQPSTSSKITKPSRTSSPFDERETVGKTGTSYPTTVTSTKATMPVRSISPFDELESFGQYSSSSSPRGHKYKSRMLHSEPSYTIPIPVPTQEFMLPHPQPHYHDPNTKEMVNLLPKAISYSSSQTLDPTEVYTGSAPVSQTTGSHEDILDLDSQHLVPSIDALPDLGLISTRDLYSSENNLTSLALAGVVSQSEAHVSSSRGSYLSNTIHPSRRVAQESSEMPSLNMPLLTLSRKSPDDEEPCSSPNSESFKKLKLDLEALNKLSR